MSTLQLTCDVCKDVFSKHRLYPNDCCNACVCKNCATQCEYKCPLCRAFWSRTVMKTLGVTPKDNDNFDAVTIYIRIEKGKADDLDISALTELVDKFFHKHSLMRNDGDSWAVY